MYNAVTHNKLILVKLAFNFLGIDILIWVKKVKVKVKIKATLVQALRLCTCRTAYRGSRGIVPNFLDHGTLPPGKTRYLLYRRLVGPQGRSEQARKISPPPGFDPQTVQPVASRHSDYATRPTSDLVTLCNSCHVMNFMDFLVDLCNAANTFCLTFISLLYIYNFTDKLSHENFETMQCRLGY